MSRTQKAAEAAAQEVPVEKIETGMYGMWNPGDRPIEKVCAKILKVMEQVESVEASQMKQGPKYNYISEAVLTKAIRKAFLDLKLVMFPENVCTATKVLQDQDKDGNPRNVIYTEGNTHYRIVDTESGQWIQVAGASGGMDFGDKSVNKAMTGVFKMTQRQTFMIPSPERDDPDNTPSGQYQKGNAAKPAAGGQNDPGTVVVKYHDKYKGKTIAEIWAIDQDAVRELAQNEKSKFMMDKAGAFLAQVEAAGPNPFN